MPEKHWVEEIFENCGAVLKGHFELASDKHTEVYFDKAKVFPHVEEFRDICWQMAEEVGMLYIDVDAVVGPASGGIILSHNVAHFLEDFTGKPVLALFTEKDKNNKQVLRRGYKELIAGKRVLIVDDILTTGGSIEQVAKEAENAGAKVAAVFVICDRGGYAGKHPFLALWRPTNIKSYEPGPNTCPLCAEGIPLEDPKSR